MCGEVPVLKRAADRRCALILRGRAPTLRSSRAKRSCLLTAASASLLTRSRAWPSSQAAISTTAKADAALRQPCFGWNVAERFKALPGLLRNADASIVSRRVRTFIRSVCTACLRVVCVRHRPTARRRQSVKKCVYCPDILIGFCAPMLRPF